MVFCLLNPLATYGCRISTMSGCNNGKKTVAAEIHSDVLSVYSAVVSPRLPSPNPHQPKILKPRLAFQFITQHSIVTLPNYQLHDSETPTQPHDSETPAHTLRPRLISPCLTNLQRFQCRLCSILLPFAGL